MEKRYFYNIDFLRFIFCLSILVLHFSCGLAMQPEVINSVSTFIKLKGNFHLGYLCVEFFFIISGFMWCLSLDKQIPLLEFAKKKIIRFWPLMFFTVICFWIISWFGLTVFEGQNNVLALSFLSGFGFKHVANIHMFGNIHTCWFISVLFWVLLFYHYLYNNCSRKWFNLFIVMIIVIGYSFLTTVREGNFNAHNMNYYGIFNIGLLRGLCAIGIGYLIGEVYKTYHTKIENIKLKAIPNAILTSINFLALSCILFNIFHATGDHNDIFFVYCFVIVILCFVFNKDLISQFFNNKYFAFMGKYTLSVYILHNLTIDIFKYGVFTERNLPIIKIHPYLFFYSGIIASIIVGIIAYYIVEKPATKYLTKFLKDF